MKSALKVLCLAPYPVEGASARLRVLQFFPHLRAAGMEMAFRPFMDSRFFRGFYQPGRHLPKTLRLMALTLRRLGDVRRAAGYDVVFIQREALLFGPPVIETLIARRLGKPVVFDFDDAIHVPSISPTYGRLAGLVKYPQKTPQNIRMSRAVIAGNRHLEAYARDLNSNVTLIPTVVDANLVRPAQREQRKTGPLVLGWMGTHSTYPYLQTLFPTLQEVAKQRDVLLRVIGAGCKFVVPGVKVDDRPWSLKSETADLQSFDIGLYPMPEDEWSIGKSGFKAIEYMAVGIPALCAPVGATCDIIEEGAQGYLPATPAEWQQRLLQLIDDADLRHRLGKAGRRRVEEWYCLEHQAPRLQEVLESASS